jgi:hypothetical protein
MFKNLPLNTIGKLRLLDYSIIGESSLHTFLSAQSQSLTRLELTRTTVVLPPIALPNLQVLSVLDSALDGWGGFYGSLTALKRLSLNDVQFLGVPETTDSSVPLRIFSSLEELVFIPRSDSIGFYEAWLDVHSRSFPRLQSLYVGRVPANTLTTLLAHCPRLTTFESNNGITRAILDFLKAFSPSLTPSLHSLTLCGGEFCPESLTAFAASPPPRLQSLVVYDTKGLTPTHLQQLLKLPLKRLDLRDLRVRPEHSQDLYAIAEQERPTKVSVQPSSSSVAISLFSFEK